MFERTIFLLAFASSAAVAQTTGAGTLVGTVTDSTGAVVAGAKVTVVSKETSFVSNTQTSTEGAYYVPYLAPGPYRLTVEAPGFKKHAVDGIVIRTGETPRVDVRMEVGAVTESIEVTGSAPLLATETASSGGILSGEDLVKIPVSQKVAQRMLFYYPNATAMSGYHVLGQRQNMIGYTVDGVNGKEPGIQNFGGTDTQISSTQDAFEEVKVYTTGTPAEFGHSAGGLMSVVFKSGTNQLHGIGRGPLHRQEHDSSLVFGAIRADRAIHLSRGHRACQRPPGPAEAVQRQGQDVLAVRVGVALRDAAARRRRARRCRRPRCTPAISPSGGRPHRKSLPIYNPYSTHAGAAARIPAIRSRATWSPRRLFDPAVQKFLAQNPFSAPNQAGIPGATGPTENLVHESGEGHQPHALGRQRWTISSLPITRCSAATRRAGTGPGKATTRRSSPGAPSIRTLSRSRWTSSTACCPTWRFSRRP